MAESMSGLARSHRCTEVSNKLIGTEVTVMGWVQKRRNLGSLIFVDLRDRSGILEKCSNQRELKDRRYRDQGTYITYLIRIRNSSISN